MVEKHWRKSSGVGESFRYAWSGLLFGIWAERNTRLQVIIFIIVMAVSFFLSLPVSHIAILILVSSLVISLELLNTAIEDIADVVEPGFHSKVLHLKDVAAGAVLFSSVGAAIIGLILLGPPLVALINS